MARLCVILIIVALAIVATSQAARDVPEDPSLSDQKNFLGGFSGNGGGEPSNSGTGIFGGFDHVPFFGGDHGGFGGSGTGSGLFPGFGDFGGSSGDHFGAFPLP